MKVALTGASGFVGRHVLAELESRDAEVTLLARRHVRDPARVPEGRHRVVPFDLHDAAPDLFDRAGRPDVLLHLAWGGLPHYDSLHHFESERPAHYRFIRQMVDSGLAHAVVTGTCYEYGLQSGPLHEALDSRPVNAYGHAKDALRRELQLLQRAQPFRLTWARLFYLHGEGQAANSLWPALRSAALRGDATFPMSGGEQLRDYLPVQQAAAHLVGLALRAREDGIVNVCAGRPVSVRALVEGWIREHGWAIAPELGRYPYPAHEPMAFWGDATRLQRCLQAG
jgi:dTDP-6-deoxy-L-talose 4-dehydrogenase (NAD+)